MRSLTELDNKITAASKDVYALIDKITDEQSFVETDKFIGSGTSLGYAAGEGVVSGIASVDDIQVGIFAINGKILLGGIGKSNAEKISKCVANAVKMSAPVIGVIDTSGARFAEGIEALEGYGKIIEAFSGAYGMVPTILVVKGQQFRFVVLFAGNVRFYGMLRKKRFGDIQPAYSGSPVHGGRRLGGHG